MLNRTRLAAAAAAAVLGAAPLALAAPFAARAVPAAADEAPPGPAAVAEPAVVGPADSVVLKVTGCDTRTGMASSAAFGRIRLQPGDLDAGYLFGNATVPSYAEPGDHQVSFRCGGPDGRSATTRLTVMAAETAEGGSFAGMSTATGTAAGGALLAAGAGTVALILRRRARTAAGDRR